MESQLSVLLLLAAFINHLDASEISDERIVGGYNAPPRPELASLQYKDGWSLCSGVILSFNKVLTTAQCCRDSPEIVSVGSNDLRLNYTKYDILHRQPHPGYKPDIRGNDIGVVTTSNMVFNSKVKAMPLPTSNCSVKPYFFNGWGSRRQMGAFSNLLQELSVKPYDRKDCERFWSDLASDEICVLNPTGKGACLGDSGGPMHVPGDFCAVMSRGSPCAHGVPDIFTNVFMHVDWIKEEMLK